MLTYGSCFLKNIVLLDGQDFLDNQIRMKMLQEFEKWEIDPKGFSPQDGTPRVISEAKNELSSSQYASAESHWRIMREIFDSKDFWVRFM